MAVVKWNLYITKGQGADKNQSQRNLKKKSSNNGLKSLCLEIKEILETRLLNSVDPFALTTTPIKMPRYNRCKLLILKCIGKNKARLLNAVFQKNRFLHFNVSTTHGP